MFWSSGCSLWGLKAFPVAWTTSFMEAKYSNIAIFWSICSNCKIWKIKNQIRNTAVQGQFWPRNIFLLSSKEKNSGFLCAALFSGKFNTVYRDRILGRIPDKSLNSFPTWYSESPTQLCIEISISSNSRNLLRYLYTVKEKGGKTEIKPHPLPYCVADPDPGSGAFSTPGPGSGIWNRFFPDPGSRIPDPNPIFFRA
jgi:hypothetical protein